MRRICIFMLALWCGSLCAQRSVGIGTNNPAPSAALELKAAHQDQGMLFPPMTDEQIRAIKNPAEGLLVYSISSGCLKRYNSALGSWPCIAGGGPFKVVTTRERDALPAPQLGMTVYNTDTQCMETYQADGSWQCGDRRPSRDTATATDIARERGKSGSLFFTKYAYPVMGVIDSSGNIVSRMGNFRVETLHSDYPLGGRGVKVTLDGNQKLLGVTASRSMGYEYSIKIQELPFKNGFSYYQYNRRMVVFIAFVRGDSLPDYARYLAPIAGKVNADGSIARGSGFSVSHLSTGNYRLSSRGGILRFLTAAQRKGQFDKDYYHHISVSRSGDSWLLRPMMWSSYDGADADRDFCFLGIVDYKTSLGVVNDGLRIIHGVIDANGGVISGSGFRVSTTYCSFASGATAYRVTFRHPLVSAIAHPAIIDPKNPPGGSKGYHTAGLNMFDFGSNYFSYYTRQDDSYTSYPILFTAVVDTSQD